MNRAKEIQKFIIFSISSLLLVGAKSVCAQGTEDISIQEKQMVEINQSLKSVIEENQDLATKNKDLEAEMEQLRATPADNSQLDTIKRERDDLANTVLKVRETNRKYAQEIKQMESNLQDLQQQANTVPEPSVKIMESQMSSRIGADSGDIATAASGEPEEVEASQEDVLSREEKTMDLLTKIDAFYEEDERLRMDAAKAHYNMGNIYYQKGEFEIAAREYYQAVTLMPEDPDCHYNLAFVSGENLNDQQTASRHYQTYLYLKPDAMDAHLVQEEILKAKLLLRNTVESPLETQQ